MVIIYLYSIYVGVFLVALYYDNYYNDDDIEKSEEIEMQPIN